jgi:DNA (cytosine-5)-methyltransferase 1
MKNEKTVAEFFAGIGLMRVGLEDAGWSVVWANDIDADKFCMYRGHFVHDSTHFDLGDVHAIDPGSVPTVSLATASFPCNDLSVAGGRRGLAGRHSSAFWGFVAVIEGMEERRPPMIMLENVPGFLTSHGGKDFRAVCMALNRLDYAVDAFIIDSALFVPQSRRRLFLIGRRDEEIGSVNERLSFYESQLRPAALAEFIFLHPEIRWSLRPLPDINNTSPPLSDILEELPESSVYWWSAERTEYLLSQMSEKHKAIADKMISGDQVSYGTVFRRVRRNRSMAELRTDSMAGCLRTPRGGSGRQILFVAGNGCCRARLLTPTECARLMGADDYRITVSLNKALFGFGDAVCVPVIRWIADNYLTPAWKEMHAHKQKKIEYVARAI